MTRGNHDEDNPKIVQSSSHTVAASARLPMPSGGPATKEVKLEQSPVAAASTRAARRLQGRSIKSVVVSNWDCTGNWVCVVPSRGAATEGLLLRRPLGKSRSAPEEDIASHARSRERKKPESTQRKLLSNEGSQNKSHDFQAIDFLNFKGLGKQRQGKTRAGTATFERPVFPRQNQDES